MYVCSLYQSIQPLWVALLTHVNFRILESLLQVFVDGFIRDFAQQCQV